MFKRIIELSEKSISPQELDILNTYSKPTPDYELDKEIKIAKRKGYDIRIAREYPDRFLLDIFREGEEVNSIYVDKKDLLDNRVDIINLIHDR